MLYFHSKYQIKLYNQSKSRVSLLFKFVWEELSEHLPLSKVVVAGYELCRGPRWWVWQMGESSGSTASKMEWQMVKYNLIISLLQIYIFIVNLFRYIPITFFKIPYSILKPLKLRKWILLLKNVTNPAPGNKQYVTWSHLTLRWTVSSTIRTVFIISKAQQFAKLDNVACFSS